MKIFIIGLSTSGYKKIRKCYTPGQTRKVDNVKALKDKKYLKYIFLLVGVLVLVAASLSFFKTEDNKQVSPVNGILDLQNWDPGKDRVLSLKGQWDFYWQKFINYQDIGNSSPTPDITADAPGFWDSYKINGKSLPGMGYGTYLLRVVNAQKGIPLSLRISTFSNAYNMYIDNQLVSSNGKVGKSKAEYFPEYEPRAVEFTPDKSSFELIIHVSNFTYSIGGGMWDAISMGTPEQIRNMDNVIFYKDLFLIGALVFIALYYLSFFMMRREDRSSLYFALMCIMIVSRVMIYGAFMLKKLFPSISFNLIVSIDYISLCSFPVFALLILGRLFPKEFSGIVQKVVSFYAAGMTLLVIITPVHFYSRMIYIVQIIALLIALYGIVCVSIAFIRGRKDSFILLAGILLFIIAGVHDLLYENNVILSPFGDLVPFGLFILMFLQSFVLSRRFSEAFKKVDTLSRELLKMDKIKDEFLANTSHELRTPLSGIIGITESMLKGSSGNLNSHQKQNLSIIKGSARRLSNLVNDILDYSNMRNGNIGLNIRPIQMEGLIQTVINVFKQLYRSNEYIITFEIPEGLPAAMADENRVVQILYNLVGNAVKFTVKGYIKVSVSKAGKMLEICVSDTGEGIPNDKLEDIFKSFEQVDNSLTRRHGGTGLGLPITKHLVELLGGSMWVESTLGEGSRFYFTLPATAGVPEETDMNIEVPEPFTLSLEEVSAGIEIAQDGTRILIVDDDVVNLQAAAETLKLEGYSVTAVNSGKAALKELERQPDYSLVILDVMMPEMSGYEVCRKLRESKSIFELPVLILTAKASTEDIVMGFEAGTNDYLPKPFEPEELMARVRTLVNLKMSVDKAMTAEVAFMQAQIKPHFLFNTLNTISSFCDTNPDHAQKLIDDFSNYLRQSFDFKSLEMYVPLERELSLISSYTEIEKARFGENLKVIFDIDSTIKIRVPMLSIQPLVENAVIHGLRKKGGGGVVTITVKKASEGALVAVKDNGQGIAQGKLNELLMPETSHGIGLWNIDRRLKKLYGKGLSIESEPGKGTRVSYIVPEVI